MNEDTYRDKLNDLQLEVEELRAKLKEAQTGDLISRSAAIDALMEAFCDTMIESICKDTIEALPSAQPEIVRCNDCKNWDTTWQNDWAKNYHYCPLVDGTRNGDWYCADAERRNDETD